MEVVPIIHDLGIFFYWEICFRLFPVITSIPGLCYSIPGFGQSILVFGDIIPGLSYSIPVLGNSI